MPAASASEAVPPVNYVFIDDENVPNLDLSFIAGKTVHIILLLGPQRTKLAVEHVAALLNNTASAQVIRLEQAGKNALDFALAYYLGRAVQADPAGCFHLVSKDGDYDPLIKHLEGRRIRIHKHVDATTLPSGQPCNAAKSPKAPAVPAPQKLKSAEDMLPYLRRQAENAPKTRKTLSHFIKAHLGKDATSAQADEVVLKLKNDGQVSFDDNDRATYSLNR